MARAEDLLLRTKRFALKSIELCTTLPNKPVCWVLGKQLLRSATSVGANYREAQRSRSRQEFISKIGICQQEIEETVYWLELLLESGTVSQKNWTGLLSEAIELRSIFSAIAISTSMNQSSG